MSSECMKLLIINLKKTILITKENVLTYANTQTTYIPYASGDLQVKIMKENTLKLELWTLCEHRRFFGKCVNEAH